MHILFEDGHVQVQDVVQVRRGGKGGQLEEPSRRNVLEIECLARAANATHAWRGAAIRSSRALDPAILTFLFS